MHMRGIGTTSPIKPIKNEGSQEGLHQLEQQKQAINKEIEKLKKNTTIKPEEKEKKIKDFQKKLEDVENQIQKLKQTAQETVEDTPPNSEFKTMELSDKLKPVEEIKNTEKISESIWKRDITRPRMDEYTKGKEAISLEIYRVGKDNDGNVKIIFDDGYEENSKNR